MKSIIKISLVLLATLTLTMCNTKQNDQKTANFDWLLGNWKRTNEEKGKETFENWQKTNDTEYNGIGFTLQNNDTLSQEQMKLIQTKGKWNLLVKTPDEKDFIKFDMTELAENKFECENDTLDFPKLIKYWKNGDKMNAIVSGDSLKLSFEFERIK
ncbi:DUF6265 family protein [Flavobacterium oreochromis]|uniref:DUF6265 family protein n=1 Tax=Flavobacterium oreochromis TaxID=2906078 RepID=A0ABW8PBV1_9FLAO|nr:DUF6265 family protein [Flavobacterium oreochromis]OWP74205.1 hypothetical protein BWG23_14640 [Flavobacterium oreochromis]POR21111.1 hypothetical protein BWK58_12890 [Flavobacterium columnare]